MKLFDFSTEVHSVANEYLLALPNVSSTEGLGSTLEEVFDISSALVDEVYEVLKMDGEDIHNLFKISDGYGYARQESTLTPDTARMEMIPFWHHADTYTAASYGGKFLSTDFAKPLDLCYPSVDIETCIQNISKIESFAHHRHKFIEKLNEHCMVFIANYWIMNHNQEIINNSIKLLQAIYPDKQKAIENIRRTSNNRDYSFDNYGYLPNNPNTVLRNYKLAKSLVKYVVYKKKMTEEEGKFQKHNHNKMITELINKGFAIGQDFDADFTSVQQKWNEVFR